MKIQLLCSELNSSHIHVENKPKLYVRWIYNIGSDSINKHNTILRFVLVGIKIQLLFHQWKDWKKKQQNYTEENRQEDLHRKHQDEPN